jgi:hypothetical protein
VLTLLGPLCGAGCSTPDAGSSAAAGGSVAADPTGAAGTGDSRTATGSEPAAGSGAGGSSAPPGSEPAFGGLPRRRSCLVGAPPGWASALDGGRTLPPGVGFTVAGYAGGSAFGQLTGPGGTAVAELDLDTGRLNTVAAVAPGAGGLGALAVDERWLVWEQLDSQTNLSDWSVHAHDRATGMSTVLAASRLPGGEFLAGQQPLPVLRHGVAAWAQPLPRRGPYVEAELRAVDLASGRVSVLDAGRLSSPVYAGPYLVWARIDAGGGYGLRAADAATLRPVELPEALRRTGPIGHLAGSARYLVWSDDDHSDLLVWPIGAASGYGVAGPDPNHHFQFLQVSGDYLLWYSGATSSIMDLRSGGAFDLAGTVAGAPGRIVAASPTGTPPAVGVAAIDPAAAPPIPGCP